MVDTPPIAVLGAGSWGTALALLLARNGRPTLLWGRDAEFTARLDRERCNARFLPGIRFPDGLRVTSDLTQTLADAQDCLLAVPSHGFRTTLRQVATQLRHDACFAWATKGLEPGTGKLLHEVAAEVLGSAQSVAVISGPTFAVEVANGFPAAVTVAASSPNVAKQWAKRLHNDSLRVYTSDDIAGVELGGAIKNVLAIAAGIADGLGFGANTRAALITRGLAEMMRLGVALGGQRETFMGLAGLGDLVLTSTDNLSRNRRLGLALARGLSLELALQEIDQVVEGVQTAREIMVRARQLGIDMPITEQVCQVLYEGRPPRAAVQALLNREQKPETC